MTNAKSVVKKALEKEECAKLFVGSDFVTGSAVDPWSVLEDVLAGGVYGSTAIGALRDNDGEATSATVRSTGFRTVDIGNGATQLVPVVLMTLNTDWGSFVTGSTKDQAVTLLHELGHIFDAVFGPDASPIMPDGTNIKESGRNTELIKKKCF